MRVFRVDNGQRYGYKWVFASHKEEALDIAMEIPLAKKRSQLEIQATPTHELQNIFKYSDIRKVHFKGIGELYNINGGKVWMVHRKGKVLKGLS
jgi:hypothetical protein